MLNPCAIPMLERLSGHHNVELVRLRINFRMPPVLSSVPGQVEYFYLNSDPSTLIESGTLKYYREW